MQTRPEPGHGIVPLGHDRALPDRFSATVHPVVDDRGRAVDGLPIAELDLTVRVGRAPACLGLRLIPVDPDQPLTGTVLRRVKVDTYVHEAVAAAAVRITHDSALGVGESFLVEGTPAWVLPAAPDGYHATPPQEIEHVAARAQIPSPRGRKGSSPPDLETVARVYRAAASAGKPPTKAVQEATGYSRAQASRFIRQARTDGILGPRRPQGLGGEEIA